MTPATTRTRSARRPGTNSWAWRATSRATRPTTTAHRRDSDGRQPSTRTLTTGSYRGNNHTFTYNVPATAWKSDTSQYNVLKLNAVSGSTDSAFLSPGTSFDCLDLLS
ncbi:polysaccharide lyase family protein [Streptomyces sp. ActVer]|uniref:polysaccharide lyase family protein n=1 Tax=Streptomyces sp. ActVer TaxID=3014558 RepID=UPI002F960AFF